MDTVRRNPVVAAAILVVAIGLLIWSYMNFMRGSSGPVSIEPRGAPNTENQNAPAGQPTSTVPF
jgi:hypothetical protein